MFLLDGTWSCAGKMYRQSPRLHRLPQLMFAPSAPSRYYTKRQPRKECLSTLEAAGLDSYPDKERLLAVFAAMQECQAASCARRRDRV